MQTSSQTLIDLETRFWQSMVDQNADTAVALLNEPALMVSAQGAFSFDHAGYRAMARQTSMNLAAFKLKDMKVVFPDDTTAIVTYGVTQKIVAPGVGQALTREMHDASTWIQKGQRWQCVMHTETPVDARQAQRH